MARSLYVTSALSLMALSGVAFAAAEKAGAKGEAPKFVFDDGLAIPPKGVFGGRSEGSNEFAEKLAACPVGKSFLEPVVVPETITDAAERAKTFKELARKASNRITGAKRRFQKNNAGYEFSIRTVDDDKLGHGVRVWRDK